MEILLEGVRASAQPCSLALLLPAVGAALLGGRWAGLVAGPYAMVAMVLAWAQAALLLDTGGGPVVGVALALAALSGTGLVLAVEVPGRLLGLMGRRLPSPALRAVTGGALLGGAAGLLWQPCVGPELGIILTSAPRDPAGQVGPMLVYGMGLLAVAALAAALPHLHPRLHLIITSPAVRLVAVAPLVGLAVVLATGRYEQLIGTLVRASSLG